MSDIDDRLLTIIEDQRAEIAELRNENEKTQLMRVMGPQVVPSPQPSPLAPEAPHWVVPSVPQWPSTGEPLEPLEPLITTDRTGCSCTNDDCGCMKQSVMSGSN